MKLCEYGCKEEAKYFFPTVKKWCCSSHFSKCPNRVKKISGKNNPMFKKDPWNKNKRGVYAEETIQKMKENSSGLKGKTYEEIYGIEKAKKIRNMRSKEMSIKRKGKDPWNKNKRGVYAEETIQKMKENSSYNEADYKKKYPDFYNLERPIFRNTKIFVKCKQCEKIFNPTRIQLTERLRSIKNGTNKAFFFCSSECKKDSEYFNRKVDPSELKAFKKYSSLVWKYTRQALKKYPVENIQMRRYNQYHLDHKFSIREGFNNNVPPRLLAHFKNLKIIPAIENLKKNTKCTITIDELYSFVIK